MGSHSMYPGYHGFAPDAHAQHQGYAEYHGYAPHMNQYPHSMPRPATMHVPHVAQHAQHAPVRTQGGHSHHGAVHTHLMNALHSAGVTNKDIKSMCKITNLIGACCSDGGHAGAAHMGDAHIGAPDAKGKKKKNKKTKVHTDIDGIPRAKQTAPTYTPLQKHYVNQVNALGRERRYVDMTHLTSMSKYDVIAFILQREKELPQHDETLSLYQYMQKCAFNVQEQYKHEALVMFPLDTYEFITTKHFAPIEVRPRPPPHDQTAPRTPRTSHAPHDMPSAAHDLRQVSLVPAIIPPHGAVHIVDPAFGGQFETQHLTFGAEVPSAYRV